MIDQQEPILFTKKLFIETIPYHVNVDKHQFTQKIKKDNVASDLYIEFNKICIYELQKYLVIKDTQLSKKLYRNITFKDVQQIENDPLKKLLILCKNHPLELSYMFYGGLIKGGNILKKYVSIEHHPLLSFDNPNELFNKFKDYLNEYITELHDQELFINVVKDSYNIIKLIFDEFYF